MKALERRKLLLDKVKYAVLDKKTQEISLHITQKSVADLLKVSRKTIYRGLPYENMEYVVYRAKMSH